MTKKTDESLNDAFGIDASALQSIEEVNVGQLTVTSTAVVKEGPVYIEHIDEDEDFEEVRGNLKTLVRKGNKMLDNMIQIAESSERDRTYEVAGVLLKNLADINKDLLNSRKTLKEIKAIEKSKNDGGSVNIDKAVFVGTTSDLLDQIESRKNK